MDICDTTKMEIDKAVDIFINQGYLTRNDVPSIDLRTFCEHVYSALNARGQRHLETEQLVRDRGYYTIIFDPDRMEIEDALKYLQDNF